MSFGFLRSTELDETNWPEIREQILRFDHGEGVRELRTYPGYPRWALPRKKSRLWPSLERALSWRRCANRLEGQLPSVKVLARLLRFSHGVLGDAGRGPVPSAGNLQALELYFATWQDGWLPGGVYHYDRAGHAVEQLSAFASRDKWSEMVPSLSLVEGGSLLWIIVGDSPRVTSKYGERGLRFLLFEAGHLMQNLCLASTSLGWATVPLGAFFEAELASTLSLPGGDQVLYVGVCGKPTT